MVQYVSALADSEDSEAVPLVSQVTEILISDPDDVVSP